METVKFFTLNDLQYPVVAKLIIFVRIIFKLLYIAM